jgi:parallel beta-helix repeat protein
MRRSAVMGRLILGVVVAMLAVVPQASAAPGTGCGMVITQSMTLTADIGPCGRGGIVIAADGVRVDLGGHTISGKAAAGDGVGVLFDGVSGAWVLNGTVTGFDAGVAIVGGDTNTVWSMTIRDNIGSLKASRPAYGDGVVIRSARQNWVTRSTIVNNGPFGGVSVFADAGSTSDSNVIERNRIIDNDVARATVNEDSGIRIEGANVTGTTIMDNTIVANGLDGITVTDAQGVDPTFTAYITRNVLTGNGFHGMANRKGDGIAILAGTGALLLDNEATGNAANGIHIGSVSSRIIGNTATGNGVYPGTTGYDLRDDNPGCDANEWGTNGFNTASQSCIS